jgi:hypothetical protein
MPGGLAHLGRGISRQALAPTQTEPPFGITQLVVVGVFVVLGLQANRRSRTAAAARVAV